MMSDMQLKTKHPKYENKTSFSYLCVCSFREKFATLIYNID